MPSGLQAAERGVSAESLFDALIASVPPGSMGLTLQPYWSPGLRDPGPEGKGAIIGFGDVHTRAHFYRALIEGLAYGLRAGRELIEARTRTPITRLVISGGGSQSDGGDADRRRRVRPRRRAARRSPRPRRSARRCSPPPAWAGMPTCRPRRKAMARAGRRFEPEPEAVRIYDALYREVYRPLYKRLEPLYRRIRAITGYPA